MANTTGRKTISNIDCMVVEPAGSSFETLICLHGIGGDHASFQPQLEGLTDTLRVVVWNMPGYGESESLSPLTFETLAKTLKDLIAELDCGPVHIMGQSIGGMIAQELYHCYPQLLKSLILVATTTAFGGKDDTFRKAFLEARLKPLENGHTMREIAQESMPAIVGKNTESAVVRSAVDSMAAVKSDVYQEVLKCLITFNRRNEWASVSCPVLLIAGSADTNAPAATMKKMSDNLSHAEFYEIEGAGHLVNLERGDEVNAVTQRFISRVVS